MSSNANVFGYQSVSYPTRKKYARFVVFVSIILITQTVFFGRLICNDIGAIIRVNLYASHAGVTDCRITKIVTAAAGSGTAGPIHLVCMSASHFF